MAVRFTDQRVHTLHQQGQSQRTIAKTLGMSQSAVFRALRRANGIDESPEPSPITDTPQVIQSIPVTRDAWALSTNGDTGPPAAPVRTQTPVTLVTYPPRLWGGKVAVILPVIVRETPVIDAVITHVPADRYDLSLLEAIHAQVEMVKGAQGDVGVSIMHGRDSAFITSEIERLTGPGDVILDLYAVDGIVIQEGHRLGRRTLGICLDTDSALRLNKIYHPPL